MRIAICNLSEWLRLSSISQSDWSFWILGHRCPRMRSEYAWLAGSSSCDVACIIATGHCGHRQLLEVFEAGKGTAAQKMVRMMGLSAVVSFPKVAQWMVTLQITFFH